MPIQSQNHERPAPPRSPSPPGGNSQADLPLATEGVLRYVWESRYGEMLIEVVDGIVYVNGDRIESAMAEGGIAQALR